MDIQAIFQRDFQGILSEATWVIDTRSNRKRFENAKKLDPNSALFSLDSYETEQDALCHIIWGIQDHFQSWESITVIGISYDEHTVRLLCENQCWVSKGENGFVCRRMTASVFECGQAVLVSKDAPLQYTKHGHLGSVCGIEQTSDGEIYLVETPSGNAVEIPKEHLSAHLQTCTK